MSKNINANLHPFRIATIALIAVTLLFTNNAVWGQAQFPHNIPVNYVYGLMDVPLDVPPGRISIQTRDMGYLIGTYSNYLNPFPASHITRNNNYISHFAGTHLEPPATHSYGSVAGSHTVDKGEAANRLWDTVYSAWEYDKIDITAGIDPSMNCHGYSTGLNSWMDIQLKLRDDYEFTRLRDKLVPGAILAVPPAPNQWLNVYGSFGVSCHSSAIEAVYLIAGTHDLTITVREKNRVSALYQKTFTMQALCPNNDHMHSGPCNMENANLPWSPIGFYVKKP